MRTLYAYCESKADSKEEAIQDGCEIALGVFATSEQRCMLECGATNMAESFGEVFHFYAIDPDHNRYNGQGLHPTVLRGIEEHGYWPYEHDEYGKHEWEREVTDQDTLQSYHQWVTTQIEMEMDQGDDS